jgi:hypothetical protein
MVGLTNIYNSMGNLKTGEYVYLSGIRYMVLGYSDYDRKWLVVADDYGNKSTLYVYRIK